MHEKGVGYRPISKEWRNFASFWNLADLGVEIDYSEFEHWYG